MRRFNPERELRKIQYGSRNKLIFGVIALLIILGISSSYALYQVRYSKRIIYTKVAPFSNKDINILAVYINGELSTEFPAKNSGYRYDKIVCDNGSTATFDNITWELVLRAKEKDKCNIYFVSSYKDESGANAPELYQGLIPVIYGEDGKVIVANVEDKDNDWYNYGEKRWANAVLVDGTKIKTYVKNGKYQKDVEIPMSDILQMYVWIPRYKYKLFNVEGTTTEEQMIDITFEQGTKTSGTVECHVEENGIEQCKNASNGNWYTHPAFTFGDTQLNGFWFGKFETSNDTQKYIIKPNIRVNYMKGNRSTLFQKIREMEEISPYNLESSEIDTHITKNIEWGAVAYLTNSIYGRYNSKTECVDNECEVRINNVGGRLSSGLWDSTITGCAASTINGGYVSSCGTDLQWNNNGIKASTTGNIYGIYDMNGGDDDFLFAVILASNGSIPISDTGFTLETLPDKKYYDIYNYNNGDVGHLGDAIRETRKGTTNWFNDGRYLAAGMWFARGDTYDHGANTGLFHITSISALTEWYHTIRTTITAQDGEE